MTSSPSDTRDRLPQKGEPYAAPLGLRDGLWFFGATFARKAGSEQTRGAYALFEVEHPLGSDPPPHVHQNEDEAFYLLGGRLRIVCGDRTFTTEPGSFVFLPRGIQHGFSIEGTQAARMLVITSPARFEGFVNELGEPAVAGKQPPQGPPAMEKLMAATAKYRIEIVGPPPDH